MWNSPTIDPKNHALYIGSGDAYTNPVSKNTDAILALELKKVKIAGSIQDTESDALVAGL